MEYVDPHNLTPAIGNEVELTADNFQQGAWLYATGERSDVADYICTKAMIPVTSNVAITVRTNVDVLSDCGFVWYNADKAYIGGTTGGAPIQWDGCFQAVPPESAAYCNVNINATGVTPASVGTVYVRQTMYPENAGLPEGYTQVEYIESTGNEYIDTGYKPNTNSRVKVQVSNYYNTNTSQTIFGARQATNNAAFCVLVTTNGQYRTDYGSVNISLDSSVNFLGKFTIDKNKNTTYFDNQGFTSASNAFDCPVSLTVFALNTSGTMSSYCKNVRLYQCAIFDNDVTVRHYISCIDSNQKAGLYDTVSGAFFANSASQTDGFKHGNIITPSPEPEPSNEWKIGDIINSDTWGIYLKNVQNIREAYYIMPDTPELPMLTAPLTFDGANAIEKLLYDIQVLYDAMSAMYRKCGTFQSGANVQQLPLQRSVT